MFIKICEYIYENIVMIFIINNGIWLCLFVLSDLTIEWDLGLGPRINNLSFKIEYETRHPIIYIYSFIRFFYILIVVVWFLYIVFSILIYVIGGIIISILFCPGV